MKKTPRSLKTKQTKYKTDSFTLLQEKMNRWKVSGRDSDGKYRRIRFDAVDLKEAIVKANSLLISSEKENTTSSKIHISDALLRSKIDRNWTAHTNKLDNEFSEYFLNWIDQQNISYWHELTYEHMLAYKKYLMQKKLAFHTIRLYFQPIRRTARWVTSNWPKVYTNICQDVKITKRKICKPSLKTKRNPFLSIHQVLDFLEWVLQRTDDEYRFQLAAGIGLQGLTGLQLQEAFRLTGEKWNQNDDTIIIEDEVKNEYRIRMIPIPAVVSGLLKKVYPDSPHETFLNAYSDYKHYSWGIQRRLKSWNKEIRISPKDLRNTIQTESIDNGWYGFHVQRYVGHAPTSIGEKYYHGNEWDRMVDLFREKVITHIESAI